MKLFEQIVVQPTMVDMGKLMKRLSHIAIAETKSVDAIQVVRSEIDRALLKYKSNNEKVIVEPVFRHYMEKANKAFINLSKPKSQEVSFGEEAIRLFEESNMDLREVYETLDELNPELFT